MILAKKTTPAEISFEQGRTKDFNYAVQETLQAGWEDITSLENWDACWQFLDRDYKYVRKQMFALAWAKMMGDPANWNLLTDSEREISARWFLVPKELRDTVYTTEEQMPMADAFDTNSGLSRAARFKKAKYEIYNRLTLAQANVIMDEIEHSLSTVTPNLRENYIEYGREGLSEGDPEGLFDYMLGTAGTSFEGHGLVDHDYVPIGYASMTPFVEKLLDIIKNGNY